MKIKVTFIPSDFKSDDYLHFTNRSLITAIATKGSGITHKFTNFEWEEL